MAAGRNRADCRGSKGTSRARRPCANVSKAAASLKIEYLTLYAFSAENWQRPKTEVFALMRLLETFSEGENTGAAWRKMCGCRRSGA